MIIFSFLFNIYLPLQMWANNIQCAIRSRTAEWQEMCLPFILSKMVNIVKGILRSRQISLIPFLGTAKEAFLLSDDSGARLRSFGWTLGFLPQYVEGSETQVTCSNGLFFCFLIYLSNHSNFLSVFHYLFGTNEIDGGTLVSCHSGPGEAVWDASPSWIEGAVRGPQLISNRWLPPAGTARRLRSVSCALLRVQE